MNSPSNWKRSLDANSGIVIAKDKYPTIRVSFDMVWRQRNSGNRYASPSGHGLLVGDRTRKPLAFILKSKFCNYCKTWTKQEGNNGAPVPLHNCTKNHDGSSSAMEPLACLEMVKKLYAKKERLCRRYMY
jgi:hypothetical protein